MTKLSKRLISLVTTVVVSAGIAFTSLPVSEAMAVEINTNSDETVEKLAGGAPTSEKYSTNPNNQCGANKTIKSASDFTEDMIVAQGVANDDPAIFRGSHEAPKFDLYSMYAAWDSENIYVGIQYTNVIDVVDPAQATPQSGRGKPNCADADIPQMLLFDTKTGDYADGSTNDTKEKTVWNTNTKFSGETKVDRIFMYSPKEGINNFAIFPVNGGIIDYENAIAPGYQMPLPGVSLTWEDGFFGKTMNGINDNGYAGYTPADLVDSSSKWCDFLTTNHSTTQDTFCIVTIKLDLLGISQSDIENDGIGLMSVCTYGSSSMGSLPMDMTMLDTATEPYGGGDSSTSHEKDDPDEITVPLANVGKSGPIPAKPKFTSFDSDVQSPQKVGTSITFNAAATSENGAVSYEYKVDGNTVQDYSSNGSYTWAPSKAGTYKVTVTAKDTDSKTATKDITYVITDEPLPPDPPDDGPQINSFTSNLSSPQEVDTAIIFTTNATGNGLSYKYYINGDLYDSGSTKLVWTPETSGNYTVKVDVVDENGKKATESVSYTITEPYNDFKITSIKPNKASSQAYVGDSIAFQAATSGAVGSVNYRFRVRKNGSLLEQSEISTSRTFTWQPTEAGTYSIEVFAQDDDAHSDTQSIDYVVKNNPIVLKFTSFTTNIASPQVAGTSIKIAAAATGNGTVKYKFQVYAGNTLKAQSSASTSKTYTWKPTVAGNYTLKVIAQDSTGKSISTTKSYKITNPEPIVINSLVSNVASPQNAGSTISFLTKATGKTTLQYQYWVCNVDGSWTKLKSYSTSNTVSWKPNTSGNYIIWVDVKDANGNIKSKYINYKINEKVTKIENTSSTISYTGSWANQSSTKFSGGSIKNATKAAKTQFTFTGTGIKMYSLASAKSGMVKITVDGTSFIADLYSASTSYKKLVFNKTGLVNKKHTVTIEFTGYSNINSNGTAINIDYFEIVG